MESPAFIDDEVIADSEEDVEQDIYPGPRGQYHPRLDILHLSGTTSAGPGSSNPYRASSVSEFPSHLQPAKAISSISAFTAGPSALPDHPARFTSPSGKGKEKAADTSITDFVPMQGTIADRAKTRQRTQKPSSRFMSDVIELTDEDEDDELSLKPSRPKPKPKAKPKAKEPTKPKQVQNTPNPTSASDPPPRPRPRPRPKRPKIAEEPAPAFAPGAGPFPPTSTPPIPSHGPEIPIATSPLTPIPHQNWRTRLTTDHAMNFDLPPSDPPIPSFTTVHTDNRVPRIETLPAGRPSSPSSLFSELSTPSKSNKRKAHPDVDAEIDELATSQGAPDNVGVGRAHISPRMMGPPPTFFAGSSSASSIVEGVNTTPSNQIPTAMHIPPGEVVDLTMLPPTLAPPKAKKPRKSNKAEGPVDEDAVPRAVVLDENDQDSDFNPAGDSATKKKGKSKAKEKAVKPTKSKGKAKESAVAGISPKAQVEVVITTAKGKARARAPAKNKGKQKDTASADKEVFKSREFIEDSDDELQLVGSAAAANDILPPAPIDNEARSDLATTLTRPTVAGGLATSSSSAAPSKGFNTQAEMKGDNPPTNRRGHNKRKTIVESDADEGAAEEGGVVHINASPSVTKKRKTGDGDKNDKSKKSKDKKGTKKVLLSDEEEEDPYKAVDDDDSGPNKEKRTKKTPRKASRKIIDDDDDEEPAGDENPEESHDSTKV